MVQEVTKTEPCLHCGKSSWCYRLGELTVCKRNAEPAPGWVATSSCDAEGSRYYAPVQQKKAVRPKQTRIWEYPARDGSPLIRVVRIDSGVEGQEPKRWQEHWDGSQWVKGYGKVSRADIPVYQLGEVKNAIAAGIPVFVVEGEPCADALRQLGLVATTNIGGSGKWRSSDTADLDGANVILVPDRDEPGLKHMERIAQDFPDAQWLYAFPNSPVWNNPPKSGGLDVADWIADYKLTANDIRAAVGGKCETEEVASSLKAELPSVEEPFTLKAADALYRDTAYVSINGSLYKWTGTHYQMLNEKAEKRRISEWCRSTPVLVGRGQWQYAYAKASYVDNIWAWVVTSTGIDPATVNPPGINCLNGVVQIQWEGSSASWKLVPHNPAVVYTYVSEIEFNPDADPTHCERLLACLEPEQQRVFIQTLAASLDLATIRRYRGREVRALLMQGLGNNGKDSLREAVRLLYGVGMSNATVNDFLAYDQGRKFCLSKLEGAFINWASENSSFAMIDKLQSLKAAITGDPLDMEQKGVDEHQMMLNTVFLFNINDPPNFQGGLEAIKSRWAVLRFLKTYKVNADPTRGELEADSRFRYDPNFLKTHVVPALLNKMLEALATLAIDGIDYSCTEAAIQAIQQETNHLWAFASDVGLNYKVGGRIYINDLWELLRNWYISNGTLVVTVDDKGKEKKEWHDQPRRGDANVKAPNQIYQRFAELFPKIKKERENLHRERRGQFYLAGIAISEASEAVSEASEAVSEAVVEAVSLTQSGCEASEAICPTPAQLLQWILLLDATERQNLIVQGVSRLDATERQNLIAKIQAEVPQIASLASHPYPEGVTASTIASLTASLASLTASPTLKVGDRVAHNDPTQKSYNWHGTIVQFRDGGADVRWKERRGMKGGDVLWHRLTDLRLINF